MVVFLCSSPHQNYVISLSPYEIYITCQKSIFKNFGSEGTVRVGDLACRELMKWLKALNFSFFLLLCMYAESHQKLDNVKASSGLRIGYIYLHAWVTSL